MCFSFNWPDSLENVKVIWLPEVKHFCPNVPIILVGNKRDLRNDPKTIENLSLQRQQPVKKKERMEMAESSTKSKEGIREDFEAATRASLQVDETRKRMKRSIFTFDSNTLKLN
ncbi:ras-like GTP-binding protein Rho1 [Drosophila grimshawi]|uniref:ras-like GTP-binding protein Rho1 n=1 Tax=Drosophila grimshawi TaxID=7222 RepID=UPI0013EF01AD|nr:ras-like GTP-binding protein Rho1 [Drosophila grimshawi]